MLSLAMYLDYPNLITESPDELARLEYQHRGRPTENRLKMLRLLKEGRFRSRRQLAPVLGYCERQLKRWFETYRRDGLEALLSYPGAGGSTERITDEAWLALETKMKQGRIARLEDARQYLAQDWGVAYRGISSISELFKRRKTKLKTGRPRHEKADAAAQAAFKK